MASDVSLQGLQLEISALRDTLRDIQAPCIQRQQPFASPFGSQAEGARGTSELQPHPQIAANAQAQDLTLSQQWPNQNTGLCQNLGHHGRGLLTLDGAAYSLQTAVGPPYNQQPSQTHMTTGCQSTATQPLLPGMSYSAASTTGVSNTFRSIINPSLLSHNLVSDNAIHGVPSDSLPHVDIISPSVKKDIIMGKDINLASLLIPGYRTDAMDRHLVQGSEIIPLKALSDSRLNRALTLPEFILAFEIYKNVMCEAYPQRRVELDSYQRNIVEMSNKFGGLAFYEYHRAFSARSASLLQNHNIKINWGLKDTNLFCMTFAGQTAISCRICNSKIHTTQFCPQSSQITPKFRQNDPPMTYARPVRRDNHLDTSGRVRVMHGEREICNNFNSSRGCSRSPCSYSHVCTQCKKPHPSFKCMLTPTGTNNMERDTRPLSKIRGDRIKDIQHKSS